MRNREAIFSNKVKIQRETYSISTPVTTLVHTVSRQKGLNPFKPETLK